MIDAKLRPPQPRGVGIVFRDGRPVVKDGWVARLRPEERKWVEHALEMRGFRLNGNTIEEVDNGNSGNERP